MPPPMAKDEGSTSGLQTVGNYTLLETIGNGTFGEVMLAVERHTRESVAVKILEKDKIVDEDARTRLMNEIAILHRVQHPKVLHLLEVVESVDAIYLITEYVAGGALFQYIVQHGRLEEAAAGWPAADEVVEFQRHASRASAESSQLRVFAAP